MQGSQELEVGGGFLLFASLVATLNTCPLAALTKLTPSPSSPTAQPTTPRLVSFRLSWSLFLDTGALGFEGQFCYQLPLALMELVWVDSREDKTDMIKGGPAEWPPNTK